MGKFIVNMKQKNIKNENDYYIIFMLTFITSFLCLNTNDFTDEKKNDLREKLNVFMKFTKEIKNINFIVFVSPFLDIENGEHEECENVKIHHYEPENESLIYKYCMFNKKHLVLPKHRNYDKDTFEYILNSHLKYEIMQNAIDMNFFNDSHFAWFDFSIIDVLKKREQTVLFLNWFSTMNNIKEQFLIFPGCWSKPENVELLLNAVHWRFCGAFFMGDKYSILNFCNLCKEHFIPFMEKYNVFIWDFNYWSYLELTNDEWKPIWYKSDHNDTLFHFSADIFTSSLDYFVNNQNNNNENIVFEKHTYSYPNVHQYHPMSASYLYDTNTNKHWLNTRYVNYWIYPNGCYYFYDEKRLIRNMNYLTELKTNENDNLLYPNEFIKCNEENIGLQQHDNGISVGLEDIRLFEMNGETKFMASSIGYSLDNCSKMYFGNYDLNTGEITNGKHIDSPDSNKNAYEKNWIPIVSKNESLFIIYKWGPFQIGKIIADENGSLKLDIVQIFHLLNPIFGKLRGSSTFIKIKENENDYLLGVAHYSEEHSPRHYYHCLVLLDGETFKPLKWSPFFFFEKLGIEFCTGFALINDIYHFWISRHDRDPLLICISKNVIPLFSLL